MNTNSSIPGLPTITQEFERLRDQWCWFLALGIAMVVLGTIAIGSAVLVTVFATALFGFLLIVGRHHHDHQLVLVREVERHAGSPVDGRTLPGCGIADRQSRRSRVPST